MKRFFNDDRTLDGVAAKQLASFVNRRFDKTTFQENQPGFFESFGRNQSISPVLLERDILYLSDKL
jgi:hypothetical protein